MFCSTALGDFDGRVTTAEERDPGTTNEITLVKRRFRKTGFAERCDLVATPPGNWFLLLEISAMLNIRLLIALESSNFRNFGTNKVQNIKHLFNMIFGKECQTAQPCEVSAPFPMKSKHHQIPLGSTTKGLANGYLAMKLCRKLMIIKVNPATMSGFLLSSSSESRIRRGPADGTSCAGGTKRATGTFLATCSSSKSITAVADWLSLQTPLEPIIQLPARVAVLLRAEPVGEGGGGGGAASVRRSLIERSRGKSEGGWQRAKTEASAVLLRSVGRRLREAEGRRKADGRGRRRRGGVAISAVPLRWSVVDCGKAEAEGGWEWLRFFASLGKI
nr:hypothetical protein Iba_chr14aCG8960 [Ipomoea batatas]